MKPGGVNDVIHRILGDLRKSNELSSSLGWRRLTFRAWQGQTTLCATGLRVGWVRNSQHRKIVSLSPHDEKPFNSKKWICWRSRDELISDVLLWTPTHGRAKAGRPARTYIQQLCEDTGCCPEDLPEAMNDREKWRERVRDIRVTSTTWWWWWDSLCLFHISVSCVCNSYAVTLKLLLEFADANI